MRVDVHRPLRRFPRIRRGLLRHLAEEVVVRERRIEVADLVREHGLDRLRDRAMQLGPAADEQRVVGDLLRHRVLEPEATLAPFARRGFDDEVRGDEDVHRVSEPVAARRAKDPVTEALADHRGQLNALLRERRQPVDARGHDRVQGRGHVQSRGALAEDPVALVIPRDRAGVDEGADRLLDEERVSAGTRDDAVAELGRCPLERRVDDARGLVVGERLEHHLREVRT